MTKEHLVVVDTQFPEQANNLLSRLRETNQKPVDLLINTHHHGDHTAGNVAFRGIVKTHVAHQNSHDNQKKVAEGRNALQNELLPSTTFTTSWSQIVGDEKITLYYWGAAHTNGDAVVHFENANVVHLGDLIFNRRFPFIDKTAGASIRNWVKVLKEVRKQFDKDTTFIFGHAGENRPVTGTKEDIKAMENYLTSLWKFGKQSRKQGKTLEQLKESTKVIQGASEWTGAGIERSLDAIWLELDGK
jgi:glyoxylase-like metal-dependent hydrolase (beta-lactamase superfamily II)